MHLLYFSGRLNGGTFGTLRGLGVYTFSCFRLPYFRDLHVDGVYLVPTQSLLRQHEKIKLCMDGDPMTDDG